MVGRRLRTNTARGPHSFLLLWQKPEGAQLGVNEVGRVYRSVGPADWQRLPWASLRHQDTFPLVLNSCLASGSVTGGSNRIS